METKQPLSPQTSDSLTELINGVASGQLITGSQEVTHNEEKIVVSVTRTVPVTAKTSEDGLATEMAQLQPRARGHLGLSFMFVVLLIVGSVFEVPGFYGYKLLMFGLFLIVVFEFPTGYTKDNDYPKTNE